MLPTVDVQPDGDRTSLKLSAFSSEIVRLIKSVPSHQWHADRALWTVAGEDTQAALTVLLGVQTNVHPDIRNRLYQTAVREAPIVDAAEWNELNYAPVIPSYEHQKVMTLRAVQRKMFAFLAEMGTGKTKAAIDTLSIQMQRGVINGALIVAPKSLLLNWQREIEAHCPRRPFDKRCIVVRGSAGTRAEAIRVAYNGKAQFIVTNYETCRNNESDLLQIVQCQPFGMVLDESTRIKTHSAHTTAAVKAIGRIAKVRLILTGTPITQGPLDAWSQFDFLDDQITGHKNYYSFKNEYAIVGKATRDSNDRRSRVVGYRNLERLARRIAPWSMRVLKRDCLDLPDKLYRRVELDMGDTQASVYRQMKEESVVELGQNVWSCPLVLTRMMRLQQIAAGFLPIKDQFNQDAGIQWFENPKVEAAEEIVEEVLDGEDKEAGLYPKVIIWCRFIEEIKALNERLSKYGAVTFHGAVKDAQRDENVDAFQRDSRVRVFIGQIKTGGIGLNLTAANHVIYTTNTFSHEERAQSEDRAHRIGQKNNVTYHDLICRKTVDLKILQTLRDKKDVADIITGDNYRDVLGEVA